MFSTLIRLKCLNLVRVLSFFLIFQSKQEFTLHNNRNAIKLNVIFTVLCTFRRKQGFVIGKIIRHINFPRGKNILASYDSYL
jgi:hypothetical protein